MAGDAVLVEIDGGVTIVTVDRPKANAIDAATSRRLGEAIAAVRDDPGQRVAILTGAGTRFFSAGWDLKAAAAGESPDADFGVGGFGGFPRLPGLLKPVIAAVNGMAVGGGFEVALSADLMVVADHAEMWLPETRIGVAADAAAMRLPLAIPHALALELLLTGRRIGAEEAKVLGIANRVAPSDRLLAEAMMMAREIAAGAPLAVAATMEIVRAARGRTLDEMRSAMDGRSFGTYEAMLASEDAREGPRAFAEGRAPRWTGR
jgi:crotonobetainyl-CoA hydratase